MKDTYSSTREDFDEDDFVLWQDDKVPNLFILAYDNALEISILIFVKAHRENNFQLYVEVLEFLAPRFFALNHTNYSRWLPVHIRDMKSLPEAIQAEFQKYWVISYSFLSIRPTNKITLRRNCRSHREQDSFKRWMIAGPEVSRILKEFEAQLLDDDERYDERFEHHNQGMASQKAFQ